MKNLFGGFLILASVTTVSFAQRPLNTTINSTSVHTEPFFVKPKDLNRGVQDLHHFPGYAEGYRNRERYAMSHTALDSSPPQQPSDGSQSQVPTSNRLHKHNKNKNAFKKLQEMNNKAKLAESQSKYNDLLQNHNISEGSILRRPLEERKVFTEKRIDLPGSGLEKDIASQAKNPLNVIKELSSSIQHTPSPPPHHEDNFVNIDPDEKQGVKCSFEKACAWTYERNVGGNNFEVTTGLNLTESNVTGVIPGPTADNLNDANGHFLHLILTNETGTRTLKSPVFSSSREKCYLEVFLHQSAMSHGTFRIVIESLTPTKTSSWVPSEILGDDENKWKYHTFEIDQVSNDFQILFEIVPNGLNGATRGHVSIDNLRLRSCFDEKPILGHCKAPQLKCNERKVQVCISNNRICDLVEDCDEKEDENSNCDKIPHGGLCDFEKDWCGWHNSGQAVLLWERHNGPTPTEKTGPEFDHTLQHTNISGYFVYVNMNQHANNPEKKALAGFASIAVIQSVVFNPPPPCHSNSSSPYKHTCNARFFIHQYGPNPGSFNISVVEMKGRENITTTLWWSSKSLGDKWTRVEVVLPNITSKYFMQVESRMGIRIYSDVAFDDFSMSPECFGYNIPAEHLGNYNYWDPRIGIYKKPYVDFIDKKFYELSTCGAHGNYGPTPDDCMKAYNGSDYTNHIRVSEKLPYKGVQIWKVPSEGYYTIIAKGAGGGLGSGGVSSSRGTIVSSVIELHKDEEIHILVGQSGENACIKSLGIQDEACVTSKSNGNAKGDKIHLVNDLFIESGGGGGGGASFVFLLNQINKAVPLVIAGGGGGIGIGRHLVNDDIQQARGHLPEKQDFSGSIIFDSNDEVTAGPGGGWRRKQDFALDSHYGASLLEGARGGEACYNTGQMHGFGGFGGGGGGCDQGGGGGGGYAGGDSNFQNSTNGEGGTSYIGLKRSLSELSFIYPGSNSGHGSVIIIPAIEGCGCDYRCVALDEYRSVTGCICPDGLRLKADNLTACEFIDEPTTDNTLLYSLFIISAVLAISLVFLFMMLYNRFQRRRQAAMRSKMLAEQDVQLARLRTTTDDGITNFNPSYGCEGIMNGGNVDVKSLPQVARESLRLVKALGQGAFGEVYQGLYRHRDGDTVEMPVAVKTLPELSTGQAENDFLMEAAIMAKFNHPNIVHLIGVCFDRHPRFIVLELLAGGDLKNFLREGRNKPERPSSLTMKDLIFCALDVAKGCRYMESKRFIHRDIAARNCLLTSKGPGRVVKIADFGMARDIYRSDYYRKGGKAMLPIKWTPPEGFLDGIFTSKTDVWSFGVLLWEVFSLGIMPYTGLLNRDVMQLVAGGGRLDAPAGCPPAIYRIMGECWNPTPELRPSFTMLLEKLTACTQDPEIMNAPLPSFFRPPSLERDSTIMRPSVNDDFCLQVPNSSDYLIPLPDSRAIAERLLTEATGVTIPDTIPTYSLTNSMALSDSNCWETSFSKPNPKPKLCSNDSMEDRLISLDTPTAIEPPQPFANSPVQNLPPHKTQHSNSITLDPAALKQGYANVKMENDMSKYNGGMSNGSVNNNNINHNNNNNNNNMPKDKNSNHPFSISMQGYNESHSEISC